LLAGIWASVAEHVSAANANHANLLILHSSLDNQESKQVVSLGKLNPSLRARYDSGPHGTQVPATAAGGEITSQIGGEMEINFSRQIS
jgi:hypothetical protein